MTRKFKNCVGRSVDGGMMDRATADDILRRYDERQAEFEASGMGPTQAEIEAAKAVTAQFSAEAALRQRRLQLSANVIARQTSRIDEHVTLMGRENPGNAVKVLLDRVTGAGGTTLYGRYRSVRSEARERLGALIAETRATVIPRVATSPVRSGPLQGMRMPHLEARRRGQELQRNVLGHFFGQDSGDDLAKRMADEISNVFERLRTRANAAGAAIPEGSLSTTWFPQTHNQRIVARAGYDEWRASILYRNGRDASDGYKLNLDAMGERWNDGIPFNERTIESALYDAWNKIRSDGASAREATSAPGMSVANRRQDPRFFEFNTAEDWLSYDTKFGSGGDIIGTVLDHIDRMAMDVALMEELGPNPNVGFAYLRDYARVQASRASDPVVMDRTETSLKFADALFDNIQGKTNSPTLRPLAAVGSGLRNYVTSALLGRAVVYSVNDMMNSAAAARLVGMSHTAPMRMMGRMIRDPSFREDVNAAGMIFENAVDVGSAVARFEMEELQFNSAATLSDFTIRASGMGWMTEVTRQAWGGSFMHTIADDWRARSFGDLDPDTQRVFRDFGMTPEIWESVRGTPVHTTPKGLTLVRPRDVAEHAGQDAADIYREMMMSLAEHAVVNTSPSVRTAYAMRAERGSIPGEVIRTLAQFKGYSMAYSTTWAMQGMRAGFLGMWPTVARAGAAIFIGNTILGGLAMQMAEVSKGNDPLPMGSLEFWTAAAAKGGGFGFLADLITAGAEDRGVEDYFTGPSISLVSDMVSTIGSGFAGEDMVKMLRRWTPGGTLWYANSIYNREILDRLQQAVDPDFAQYVRRQNNRQSDRGTSSFYGPGQSIFDGLRAPDLSNAFGG